MKNKTPFHYAVEMNRSEMIYQLISKGADINAKKFNGKVPKKMWACEVGKMPIHFAAEKNLKHVGEILIEKGADVNAIDIVYFYKEIFFKYKNIKFKYNKLK